MLKILSAFLVIFYTTFSYSDECYRDRDCSSGHECYKGKCIKGEYEECRFNRDCRSHEECHKGHCISRSRSGSNWDDSDDEHCHRDWDCDPDEYCRKNRCVDRKEDFEKGTEVARTLLDIFTSRPNSN